MKNIPAGVLENKPVRSCNPRAVRVREGGTEAEEDGNKARGSISVRSLLLGKAPQVGWPGWPLSSAGTLRMGTALSSPSEEERGELSARLPSQFLFPIGQSFPPTLTPLHFWVTSIIRARYKLLGKPHPVAQYVC